MLAAGRESEPVGDPGPLCFLCAWLPNSALLALLGAACTSAGCGFGQSCEAPDPDSAAVVLTFDDGPFAADEPLVDSGAVPAELLGPLLSILDTLDRRGARAVFFVKGSGDDEVAGSLRDVFASGLLAVSERGHVLGYHGFNHDPRIWAPGFQPAFLTELRMHADLNRLEQFLDDVLAPFGRSRESLFAPVFRQPYAGAGVNWRAGERVAAARGWTYHGYAVDSGDWTVNPDVPRFIAAALPSGGDEAHVEFVMSSLRVGTQRNAHRHVVDVLFHVNHFTADHLDTWLDTLAYSWEVQIGRTARFEVPACYLLVDDPQADFTIFNTLLVPDHRQHAPPGR